jgi:hypothetical protein
MEGRRKVREVMLDPVHLAMKALSWEVRHQQLLNAPARLSVLEPVENEREVWTLGQYVGHLPEQIGPVVLINGDVLDIGEPEARFAQAVGDRVRREAGPMLQAAKSLLFRRRNERAVAHQGGRRIGVECIEAEDDHLFNPRLGGTADRRRGFIRQGVIMIIRDGDLRRRPFDPQRRGETNNDDHKPNSANINRATRLAFVNRSSPNPRIRSMRPRFTK